MTATVAEALGEGARLTGGDGRRDAQLLLAHCLGRPREHLFAHPEASVGGEALSAYRRCLGRRGRGEPVAYITGRREFYGLELEVNRDVLVPRPETELLVDAALTRGADRPDLKVADLGTGSGAVAIALAAARPGWRVQASDICPRALAVARRNAAAAGVRNIAFRLGDWCAALDPAGGLDMIAANPPYVAPDDPHLAGDGLPFEPPLALVARDGGFAALAAVARQARGLLKPGGRLLLEHGRDQRERLARLLAALGYRDARCERDLAGHDRMTEARRP